MSSPLPVDPYLALGVAKDADLSAIRSAHRRLILKYHPDRVKDEADRPRAKDEFQKVQQAYELLSDSAKRTRYDDKIKLAELRKEAMLRDPLPTRTATYPAPRVPPPTPSREYRDDRIYEERVPRGASYFDEDDRFREEPQRASARKADEYGHRSTAPPHEREREREKERDSQKKSSKWEPRDGLSFDAAFKLKRRAAQAKENVREKEREKEKERERERVKEKYAASAKSRDRDRRRDSTEKYSSRRAYVEDDDSSSSSSDSDTATPYNSRSPPQPSKPSYTSSPRARSKTEPTRKPASRPAKYDEDVDDEWERRHEGAREYIQLSQKRPGLSRTDTQSYWHGQDDRGSGRRSGSDSDRRKKSSSPIENPKVRPKPALPTFSSAPAGLKSYVDEREPAAHSPQAHRSTSHIAREVPRPPPSMPRHNSMPVPSSNSRRNENITMRGGSKLRHAETPHDSGYSSTSPRLPDVRDPSPPRIPSKKYHIVEEDEEFSRNPRTVLVDDEDRHRISRSPSPNPRDRNRDRERDHERRREKPQRPTVSTDGSFRAARGVPYNGHNPSPVEPSRPPLSRHESMRHETRAGAPRDAPPLARENSTRAGKLPYEISPEQPEPSRYTFTYPKEKVSASPRISPEDIKYSPHARRPSLDYRETDYYPGSHRDTRNVGRRPSVY